MSEQILPIRETFRFNSELVSLALDDLSPEDAGRRLKSGEGSSIAYLVGHLCSSRYGVLKNLGREAENPYKDLHGDGVGSKDGSAYPPLDALVDKAIEAIALAWTRRGPPTRLTERFVQLAGAEDAADLLEGVSLDRYRLAASAAPTVFQVAAEGDPVAAELVLWAGRSLGSLANGVIRQLGFEALAFEVVLVGSFFNGSPLIIETMGRTIHTTAPGARLEQLAAPPVIGGVLLGMEQAGMSPLKLRKRLIQSTLELLT